MINIRWVVSRLSLVALANTMNTEVACGRSCEPPAASRARADGPARLARLSGVPGHEQHRRNDILLLRAATGTPGRCDGGAEGPDGGSAHVVFFPGDIQNFQQEMALQADSAPWQSWSLERVAFILGCRFPGHHIWVIRASRMYLHKFSCYQNFVESNLFGAPEHSPDYGALRHLRGLLTHGMERAGLPNPLPPLGGGPVRAPIPRGFSLTLVGFSKGCVVLNQMVHELAGARRDSELRPFLDGIVEMYWLDGGHPGGSETWVTDQRVLAHLAASGVALHAHVTPYEVRDPMRAWVGREHKSFIKSLEELGACITHRLHFEDEPASIDNHFRVITEF
ncbi:mitochondrial protein C2orf69 homolog [Brachyhypopomus gauderio]|uniref:mitochondrial protein C2orf69 homolog n=1 Tax=Brachyhypopomus gauderio TaxID=698409 RepID=UPI0040410339